MSPLFLFLSFVALLIALGVVLAKNPVHSVLFLILTFFTLSGHYLLLNAQFNFFMINLEWQPIRRLRLLFLFHFQ